MNDQKYVAEHVLLIGGTTDNVEEVQILNIFIIVVAFKMMIKKQSEILSDVIFIKNILKLSTFDIIIQSME